MDPHSKGHSLLLFVVVHSQDVEALECGLQKIKLSTSLLPSIGGFLGRKNTTLLIGCPEDQLPAIKRILQENCRQRIDYMALPLYNNQMSVPLVTPTAVAVGGATLFSFEVEYQEEIL